MEVHTLLPGLGAWEQLLPGPVANVTRGDKSSKSCKLLLRLPVVVDPATMMAFVSNRLQVFFLCLNFSRGFSGNFSFGARFFYILHSFSFCLLACVECLRRKRKLGSFAQVESKQTALLRQLHLMRAVHLVLCRQACKLVRLPVRLSVR